MTGGVYMPLDAGFCDTQCARHIQRAYGAEGFLAYVRLHCMLLREPSGSLSVESQDDWADIADQLGMDVDEAMELVRTMRRYRCAEVDGGVLTIPAITDSIRARNDIRKKRAAAGRASGKARKRTSEDDKAGA